ncbi:MAG: class I SAM-dependent methyltransferase [Desulfomonilaceae bacterium]
MNPSQKAFLKSLSYSLRRYYVDDFYLRHAQDLEGATMVLDVGGNRVQKRGAFDAGCYNSRVVYANISVEKMPHVQCRGERLPLRANSVDVVICSELLEHVKEPAPVLIEIFRVLRGKGILLLCAPFLNRIHADPSDYGRYTEFYWREALTGIGFTDIMVEWQGSYWSVLIEMLRYAVSHASLSWGPGRSRLIRPAAQVFYWLKIAAIAMDRADDGSTAHKSLGFTTGFGVKAVKP